MSAPRRQPISPAQVQFPLRGKDSVNGIEELLRFRQMLQNVRANNQVILTQGANLVAIKIDAVKSSVGKLRQQSLVFVSESNLASSFHQCRPKNAVSAAEIERPRLRSQRNATPLDPLDCILGLERVKCGVVPLFEVLGQEPVNNHAGRMVRKTVCSSKTVPGDVRHQRGGRRGGGASSNSAAPAEIAGGNPQATDVSPAIRTGGR